MYGTDIPIDWKEVYTRISVGMPMEDIEKVYGQGRKIALWAEHDGVDLVQELSDIVDAEIMQRRTMNEVEKSDPEVAKTMREVVNEYAPDVARLTVELSRDLIKKGSEIVNDEYCTSTDLKNIAQAVQTMTDTIQVSERFSTNAGQGVGVNIQVQGFEFALDAPKKTEEVILEVEDNG